MSARIRGQVPEAAALVVLTALLGLALGPAGVLVALVTIACRVTLSLPFAIAGGHVALAALIGSEVDPLAFVAVEAAFVGWLVLTVRPFGRPTVVAIAAVVGLGSVTWLAVRGVSLWLAALTTVLALALASYAIHRVALVRVGLVTDSDSPNADADADSPDRLPTNTPDEQ
ncbi:hypothetical protein [Halovivax gelatinilyticus]|uniref:hypothetical protein n=1 Tax=Halovivax gelatinilyticus TaxID=2961597 RepID=UPI0020CA2D97|nr:hypothetical protein [Halovivax gelatinilyticus]